MPAVLSVGQCGYDDSRIGQIIRSETGASLERASSSEEAKQRIAAKKYDLVLVNRVFDAGTGTGLEFIADLKKNGIDVPVMLVSDYADAQKSAVAAGALPGFGKASMFTPDVAALLKKAVAGNQVNA